MNDYACHKYANGCICPRCRVIINQINAHRQAGRDPFNADGEIKSLLDQPKQPWDAGSSRVH